MPLHPDDLRPNLALKEMVDEWTAIKLGAEASAAAPPPAEEGRPKLRSWGATTEGELVGRRERVKAKARGGAAFSEAAGGASAARLRQPNKPSTDRKQRQKHPRSKQ